MAVAVTDLLLPLILTLTIGAANDTCSGRFGNLSCVVDYLKYMDCVWRPEPDHQEGNFTLDVDRNNVYISLSNKDHQHCRLRRVPEFPGFSCQLSMQKIMNFYEYRLSLHHHRDNITCVIDDFMPSKHIRLLPPDGLSAAYNSSSNTCQLQWRTDRYCVQTTHKILCNNQRFQLLYWPKDKPQENKTKLANAKHMTLEGFELLDTVYQATVRCQPSRHTIYLGPWSHWSKVAEWSIEREVITGTMTGVRSENTEDWSHLMIVLFIPLSVAALISIILYFKIPSRFIGKINQVVIHVPSPADFFQPLYTEHNGNFKDWVENGGIAMAAGPGMSKRALASELPASLGDSQPEAVSSITSWSLLPMGKALPEAGEAELSNGDWPRPQNEFLTEPGDELRSAYGWQYLGGEPRAAVGSLGWLPPEGSSVALLFPFPWERGPSSCYSDEYCTLSHSDLSHGLLTLASQASAIPGSGVTPPGEGREGPGGSWPERGAGKSEAVDASVCE